MFVAYSSVNYRLGVFFIKIQLPGMKFWTEEQNLTVTECNEDC